MKMNRLLASVAVASALLSAGAMAADGTITFNGNVTASACTALTGVSVGGSTPTVNATVTLPNVPAPALNLAAGTYLGHTSFNIQLTGCEAVGALANVRTVFDTAAPAATDNHVMGNTAALGAADVGVAILTTGGTQIDLNGGAVLDPGAALPPAASPGPIVLNYVAAYKSLSTAVTAGPVTGTANYTISYF